MSSRVQTMRSPGPHSRRQIVTPSGNNNKRNNNDGINGGNGSKPSAITTKNLARPSMHRAAPPPAAAAASAPSAVKFSQPVSNNHLLAGYLAQEFLSKGTLFGEAWDPDRTEDSKKRKKTEEEEEEEIERIEIQKQQRYIEVADILKGEATHLPGIFNPSQLARFLQMG